MRSLSSTILDRCPSSLELAGRRCPQAAAREPSEGYPLAGQFYTAAVPAHVEQTMPGIQAGAGGFGNQEALCAVHTKSNWMRWPFTGLAAALGSNTPTLRSTWPPG